MNRPLSFYRLRLNACAKNYPLLQQWIMVDLIAYSGH